MSLPTRKLYFHQRASPKLRLLFIGLAAILCIGITVMSLRQAHPTITVTNADKLAHGAAYFIFGLAALPALGQMRAVYVWALLSGYGGAIELVQGAMDMGRKADVFDALANASGAAFALCVWLAVSRIISGSSSLHSP